MDGPGVRAVALLLLAVPASFAERALLNHNGPQGGPQTKAVMAFFPGVNTGLQQNYRLTNGNGTWAYSYYSSPDYNGNAVGQGSGVSYNSVNVAWYNIIQGTGQGGCTAQANFLAQGATIFTAAYDQDTGRDFSVTPANVPVATRAPGLYHYSYAGITKMYFPSKTVGVAVGQNIGGTMSSRSPAGWPTISGTFCDTPSILLSFDAGVTWTWATATPTFQIQAAAASYVGTLGAEAVAYPHITSGDYMSVFFASKSLGWTVGGSCLDCLPYLWNNGGGACTTLPCALNTAPLRSAMSYGMVLMTTNGGTVWRNKPLFFNWDTAYHTCMVGDAKLVSNLYSQKIPGFLFDVQSDGSGKHVYAVGGNRYSASSVGTASPWAVTWQMEAAPTILYSGDRGNSWVFQDAPARPAAGSNQYPDFAFTAVAVQKGTTAWAVGGRLGASFNGAAFAAGAVTGPLDPAGMIIGTTNGGFTWSEMLYPKAGTKDAPTFTCVAVNGNAVWVGGFLRLTDDLFPVPAVDPGLGGYTAAKGVAYTLLVALDGRNFNPVPVAALPPGFALEAKFGNTLPSNAAVNYRDIYGITWDSASHGWIYGSGFIMGTTDRGVTWHYETPTDLVTSMALVTNIASVPTSH